MTAPYQAGPPTAAGSPPPSVRTAFNLLAAAVALYVVSIVLSFLGQSAQIDAALKQAGVDRSELSAAELAQVEAAIQGSVVVVSVILLVLIALFLLFVFLMRTGKNWARIVTTVLAAFFVLFLLIGLPAIFLLFSVGGLAVVNGILSVLVLILTIAGIVFMYRPDANAYFSAPR